MDTRFWGPPGWRLLHLISVSDALQRNPGAVREWFTLMAYVLPCKFCRASYTEYITEDPIPRSRRTEDLARWLWSLHNKVNAKLRSQHLPTAPDPSFNSVLTLYKDRLAAGCTKTEFEGWDFLFAIAENHPYSRNGRNSQPMPDMPTECQGRTALSDLERNRWNILSPVRRMRYYSRFWYLLPKVLPYREWEAAWLGGRPVLQSRPLLLKWLWGRRCEMETKLELLNRDRFDQVCARLAEARSGCGSKKRAKTCRSHNSNIRVMKGAGVKGGHRTRRILRGQRQ
jgi:hypothetical protein